MKKRLIFLTGAYILIMILLGFLWYRYQWSGSFRFFDDSNEWALLDKLGHFFICYLFASWLGNDEEHNNRSKAALVVFSMVSSIELADGFSRNYGCSIYDLLANALGVVLAYFIPRQQSIFVLKFSFWPSGMAHLRPEMLGKGLWEQWLKDYNGQSYWLSLPLPYLIFPNRFPPWLGISVGYGAGGMLYGQPGLNPVMFTEWMIAPDILFSAIPQRSASIRTLFFLFDLIKIPVLMILWQPGSGIQGLLWP